MIGLDQVIEAWNVWFHAPESFHTIAAFRMLWGGLLLVSGLLMAKDARRYYGPNGVLSASRHQQVYGKTRLSLFQVLPDTLATAYLVLGLHLMSCGLVMVGWFTRTSTAVCWLTLVSLHHRNPCVVHSGDTVLRLLTFLLIFSRAGDAYSVDEWLAKQQISPSPLQDRPAHMALVAGQSHLHDVRKSTNSDQWHQTVLEMDAQASFEFDDTTTADPVGSPWAVRLMQIQICIVYLRTVFWKLRGRRWWDGTAAYYPTQVTSFARVRLPAMFVNRFWIGLATYGTLVGETALGLLVWVRELRYPVLLAGVTMHLILEVFLNLQLFGWTMIVSFIVFVPPEHVRDVMDHLMNGFALGP